LLSLTSPYFYDFCSFPELLYLVQKNPKNSISSLPKQLVIKTCYIGKILSGGILRNYSSNGEIHANVNCTHQLEKNQSSHFTDLWRKR
jgi:hypothetical protein